MPGGCYQMTLTTFNFENPNGSNDELYDPYIENNDPIIYPTVMVGDYSSNPIRSSIKDYIYHHFNEMRESYGF